MPERRMLRRTFADGSVRTALLQRPVTHQAGDRHPVIVWAYPNAKPTIDNSFTLGNSPINVIYPIQYLLTKGFAILQAPFPIHGRRSARPMRAAVEAVMPWLDVLADEPDVRAGEYGFFGHSNAGYVALALEALTSRFKAIVAWDTFPAIGYDTLHSYAEDVALSCGANLVQGFRMFYEDPRQPYAPRPAPPWKEPLEYIGSDPVFNMAAARTPLLLVEGEFDVSPREMEQVYSILYGRGIPVELAYYWGEGHVFGSPGNIHDCWLRTEGFFKRYLQKL
jgi:dipeptidyl aminopeptidase/acylaminoacyl peptidase